MTARAGLGPGQEIFVVIAIVLGAMLLSPAIGFQFTVPASVVFAVIVVTFLQRAKGQSWKELGLRRPSSMTALAGWTVAIVVVVFVSSFLIVNPLSVALELPRPDLTRFVEMQGDRKLFLIWLIPIAWGAAAFGEEMLLRGFLLNRLATLMGGSDKAWVLAVVIQAALFGLGHQYQGITGILATTSIGLIMGTAYLLNGRNLWPLILAHGLVDTAGLTSIYFGFM